MTMAISRKAWIGIGTGAVLAIAATVGGFLWSRSESPYACEARGGKVKTQCGISGCSAYCLMGRGDEGKTCTKIADCEGTCVVQRDDPARDPNCKEAAWRYPAIKAYKCEGQPVTGKCDNLSDFNRDYCSGYWWLEDGLLAKYVPGGYACGPTGDLNLPTSL